MRKTRKLLVPAALLLACISLGGGAAGQPIDIAGSTVSLSLPGTHPWDVDLDERLRRIRDKLGNPGPGSPLKSTAALIRLQLALVGLPDGLTAADLAELEIDAVALRDCASSDPKPPAGTDFETVVLLHDLGNDLLKHIGAY